jgi:predicted benzoate:H+ symporter BenE
MPAKHYRKAGILMFALMASLAFAGHSLFGSGGEIIGILAGAGIIFHLIEKRPENDGTGRREE